MTTHRRRSLCTAKADTGVEAATAATVAATVLTAIITGAAVATVTGDSATTEEDTAAATIVDGAVAIGEDEDIHDTKNRGHTYCVCVTKENTESFISSNLCYISIIMILVIDIIQMGQVGRV